MFSCSNSHPQPDEPNINVELISVPYAFSNCNLPLDNGAKFYASIFGDVQIGDEVFISLGSQIKDGKEGQYLSLDAKYDYFKITAAKTDFIFVVNPVSSEDKSFYSVFFTLNIHIFRNNQILYKTQLDNLYFFNATATPKEMFLTQESGEETTVLSFNPDPIIQEQLKLCNILLIPYGTTNIAKNAFSDLSIPDNIEMIFLDAHILCPIIKPTLKSIGDNAFMRVHWPNDIVLPESLEWIGDFAFYYSSFETNLTIPNHVYHIGNSAFEGTFGTSLITLPKSVRELGNNAFYDMKNVLQIDLTDFSSLSDMDVIWGKQLLSSTAVSSEKKVLFNLELKSPLIWKTFFQNHDTDLSFWRFVGIKKI